MLCEDDSMFYRIYQALVMALDRTVTWSGPGLRRPPFGDAWMGICCSLTFTGNDGQRCKSRYMYIMFYIVKRDKILLINLFQPAE